MQRILVVEDEPDLRKVLATLLKRGGYTVDLADSGTAACEKLGREIYDLVVTDLKLPGADGIEVLRTSKELYPDTPVIIITAYSTDEAAEGARRLGAFNYILKPFDTDKILADVGIALGWKRLGSLMLAMEGRYGFDRIVARSEKMKGIMELVAQVAPTGSTVMLTGESGSGKELVARAIHSNSPRRGAPFISINCGALPDELLESELFGHVKGSFTGAVRDKQGLFAAARGGTFFLDEVGEMPPSLQIKLLRVLQEREVIPVGATETIPVDVRIVAATNRDLEEEVRRGHFRSDLFYRLNVIAIELPSLRDRRDDLVMLIDHFFGELASEREAAPKALSADALDAVMVYDWPGNVRELQNALEHAVVLSKATLIEPGALPERITRRRREPLVAERSSPNPSLEVIERAYIMWVLQAEGGNKTRAAEVLGIDPSTLYRKLSRYEEQPAAG